ncbi:MAG: serine protease [Verrucomicrobiota bacterium]
MSENKMRYAITAVVVTVCFIGLVPSPSQAQESGSAPLSKSDHFATAAREHFLRYAYKTKRTTPKGGSIQPRIVGGGEAPVNGYPWMAALIFSDEASYLNGQFCGGALVHPYWVVTAAHCVEGMSEDDIDVALGVHDLNVSAGTQRIGVAEIIMHPEFRTFVFDADIALLRLENPANSQFTPLPLIDELALANPGVMARALGWGNTTPTGSPATRLQQVDLPIVNMAVANGSSAYDGQLTGNMLPAGLAGGGKDACQGDSGGPLVVPSPIGDGWMLAGVVSWGNGCAQPNAYGIYSRVSIFRQFVLGHLYPGYAAWEDRMGVLGEYRDNDMDNRDHFGEFSFYSDPSNRADSPQSVVIHESEGNEFQALKFRKPVEDGEVTYKVQHATVPGSWTTYDVEGNVVYEEEVPGEPDAMDVTVVTPVNASAPRGFLRATAIPSYDFVNGLRELDCPGRADGALTSMDEIHPTLSGRRIKTYELTGLSVGVAVSVTARSGDFDVRLELVNADTGAIIAASTNDSAGGLSGEDEALNFTPASGIDYHIRITSEGSEETGAYRIGVFKTADYNALTSVSVPSTTNSALTTADMFDPFYLPTEFYAKDYRLIPGDAEMIQVSLSSTQFLPFVAIVNAETGEAMAVGGGSVSFTPIDGLSYIIRVSTGDELDTGSFTLSLSEPSLESIAVGGSVTEFLTTADETDPNFPGFVYYKDDYLLTGATVGQSITVSMSTGAFDTFLFLIDLNTGAIIDSDDDSGSGFNSLLTFTVSGGVSYLIRATSAFEGETGAYFLGVSGS